MIAPRQDDADSLVLAGRRDESVGDDAALKVDVGLGVDGGVGEFHGRVIVVRRLLCKWKDPLSAFKMPGDESPSRDLCPGGNPTPTQRRAGGNDCPVDHSLRKTGA